MLAKERVPVLMVGAGGAGLSRPSCCASRGLARCWSSSGPMFPGNHGPGTSISAPRKFSAGWDWNDSSVRLEATCRGSFAWKHWPRRDKRNSWLSMRQLAAWTMRRSLPPCAFITFLSHPRKTPEPTLG